MVLSGNVKEAVSLKGIDLLWSQLRKRVAGLNHIVSLMFATAMEMLNEGVMGEWCPEG